MLVNSVSELLQNHPRSREAGMSNTEAVQICRSSLHSIPERCFRKFLHEIVPEKKITKEAWIALVKENQSLSYFISRCCGEHLSGLKTFQDLISPAAVSPVPLSDISEFVIIIHGHKYSISL